jgi:hypothetical protein
MDGLKEGFYKIGGLISKVSGLISECFNKVALRGGHCEATFDKVASARNWREVDLVC